MPSCICIYIHEYFLSCRDPFIAPRSSFTTKFQLPWLYNLCSCCVSIYIYSDNFCIWVFCSFWVYICSFVNFNLFLFLYRTRSLPKRRKKIIIIIPPINWNWDLYFVTAFIPVITPVLSWSFTASCFNVYYVHIIRGNFFVNCFHCFLPSSTTHILLKKHTNNIVNIEPGQVSLVVTTCWCGANTSKYLRTFKYKKKCDFQIFYLKQYW